MPTRFHWTLPTSGDPVEFCRSAEDGGINQVLLPSAFHRPDPVALAAHLAAATKDVGLMICPRTDMQSPTHLVRQVNTLSTVTGGRVSVLGACPYDNDFRAHDEFWTVCDALWRDPEFRRINPPFTAAERDRPELYFSGSSSAASDLAVRHGDVLLLLGDAPAAVAGRGSRVRAAGREVGLLFSVVCRRSRAEAVDAALALTEIAGENAYAIRERFRLLTAEAVALTGGWCESPEEDADHWPRPYLWTGAMPFLGPLGLALVGTPDELADAVLDYRRAGVTHILCHGDGMIPFLPGGSPPGACPRTGRPQWMMSSSAGAARVLPVRWRSSFEHWSEGEATSPRGPGLGRRDGRHGPRGVCRCRSAARRRHGRLVRVGHRRRRLPARHRW
ncbi:LLM class flavin-dependent oxidoreductase [Kutzneria kofuensis]|uniref:LLM class flavin-dependent oxidoreductase n=1 Tax=Kutzneria kofuensis TaxID=103725 RepID=UPI0031EDF806